MSALLCALGVLAFQSPQKMPSRGDARMAAPEHLLQFDGNRVPEYLSLAVLSLPAAAVAV